MFQILQHLFKKTITGYNYKKILSGLDILNQREVHIKSISIVGGVSNNMYIKNRLENIFDKKEIKLYYPIKEMMSDNAAMIAWACHEKL